MPDNQGAAPGRHLSHYELIEKIGEGGMGVVYKARDPRLQRFVALKVLTTVRRDDSTRRKRLLREAQLVSALNHPNIVVVHDIGIEDDTDFIVMEFVDGAPLSRLISPNGLVVKDALDYGVQIAGALEAAHAAGVIHRDLKPANVVITPTGRAKVLDFGLAKITLDSAEAEAAISLTREGAIIGTLAYMAPEQAFGKPADERSDIFSFGVLFHQMLTGALPFDGDNGVAMLHSMQYDAPKRASDERPGLPRGLDRIIGKALEKSPGRRYANFAQVGAHLRRLIANPDAGLDEMEDMTVTAPLLVAAALNAPRTASAAGDPHRGTHSTPTPAGMDRTSIAVIPFESLSSDKEDSYMAAGISSEIIAALSGVPDLRIASHLSSFQFQARMPDLRKAAEVLNIRYVLTGNVRHSGNRIRVIAELSDAWQGTVRWSKKYDRAVEDLFLVQEEIAAAIVRAAGGQLLQASNDSVRHIPTDSLDAWGLVRKAYYFWTYAYSMGGVNEAVSLLERAVALDPNYAAAHALLSICHMQRVILTISPDPGQERALALAEAELASQLDPRDPTVLENTGFTYLLWGRWEQAVQTLRMAVETAPFNLVAWGYLGIALGWGGEHKEVCEADAILARLIEDTPDHPSMPYWLYFKTGSCFRLDRFEEGAACARRSMDIQPRLFIAGIQLANALGYLGRMEEAREAMQSVLAINPYVTQEAHMRQLLLIARTEERAAKIAGGLRLAGIWT